MEEIEIQKTPEQKDIEYLVEEIEEIHKDPYKYVDEEIFIESLKKSLEVDTEFFSIAIQESLALLKDSHTHVKEEFRQEESFPIKILEMGGDFYIIGTEKEDSHLLGMKILEINGIPLEKILPELSKLSSKENDEVLKRDLAWYLESNKILRYYGFSDKESVEVTTDKGKISLSVKDNLEDFTTLKPTSWKEERLDNPTYEGNRFYQFVIEGNTLIFQYNDCTNEDFGEEYLENFKKKLLERLKDVENIVIDLRQNDGGSTNVMEDLFERFPKDKKIYVAMGRRTYSATMHHLLYLKRELGAILVGENAGQKANRFGDRKRIVLPNSNLSINCSFKYFNLLPENDIDVVQPDIDIPISIEDYMKGRDPLDEWIKNNL